MQKSSFPAQVTSLNRDHSHRFTCGGFKRVMVSAGVGGLWHGLGRPYRAWKWVDDVNPGRCPGWVEVAPLALGGEIPRRFSCLPDSHAVILFWPWRQRQNEYPKALIYHQGDIPWVLIQVLNDPNQCNPRIA